MSYLVLYRENSMSRIRVHIEDDNVPVDALCWWVEATQINRALARVKKFWLSGSVYEKGALLVIDQIEAAEHLRAAIGPSLEERIEAKEAKSAAGRVSMGTLALVAVMCIVVVILWFIAQSILVISMGPALLFVTAVLKRIA